MFALLCGWLWCGLDAGARLHLLAVGVLWVARRLRPRGNAPTGPAPHEGG